MEELFRARKILEEITPLWEDCGALCQAACCRADADGQGGVYLFPGEEALLKDCSWGRIERDTFGPMLICLQPCDRAKRPLACRLFPLTPCPGSKGWTVRMDARARAMCPLSRAGLRGLSPEFLKAARRAVLCIAQTPEGEAFLRKWHALEEEFRRPLW